MAFGRTVHVSLVVRLGVQVPELEFHIGLTTMIMMLSETLTQKERKTKRGATAQFSQDQPEKWSMVYQEKYTLTTTASLLLIK